MIITKDKNCFRNFGSFAVFFHQKLITSKNQKMIYNQVKYINFKLELMLKSEIVTCLEYRDFHIYIIDRTIEELLTKMRTLLERAF